MIINLENDKNDIIKTKYNIGDIIEVELETTTREYCPYCNGHSIITFNDKDYKCPVCNGDGMTYKWIPVKCKREIEGIDIFYNGKPKSSVTITYKVKNYYETTTVWINESDIN